MSEELARCVKIHVIKQKEKLAAIEVFSALFRFCPTVTTSLRVPIPNLFLALLLVQFSPEASRLDKSQVKA